MKLSLGLCSALMILGTSMAAKSAGPQPISLWPGTPAGGHHAANLSNNHDTRTYPLVDEADQTNCRPDFCVLIYPGEFLAMAEDDGARVENALFYYPALKNAKVPAEMHLYPNSGHGYGMRRTEHDVTSCRTALPIGCSHPVG